MQADLIGATEDIDLAGSGIPDMDDELLGFLRGAGGRSCGAGMAVLRRLRGIR